LNLSLREIIDIEYSEFFEIGDKVCLVNRIGVVVQTYQLENNIVTGGKLIVCWDSPVDCDFEVIRGEKENFLFRIDQNYEFEYINDDGTKKQD
jgi:hypothetical protein